MEGIAKQIHKYFPSEDETTYYKKSLQIFKTKNRESMERVRASGKLVSKWNNRHEKETSKCITTNKIEAKNVCYTIPLVVKDISDIDHQELIRLNLIANLNYPIQMILSEWIDSREARFKYIYDHKEDKEKASKIFQYWPTYNKSQGHILFFTNIYFYSR
ncbi:hypothetical protein ACFFRR_009658 [Megaselia abdita]